MSASPWSRPDESAPPMPEVTRPGEPAKGPGRLSRYANLFKRSIHFKYNVACVLSSLLPDVASGSSAGASTGWPASTSARAPSSWATSA